MIARTHHRRTFFKPLMLAGVAALLAALSLLPASANPGTTERVSVDSAGVQGNDDSRRAVIAGDGRFVAFASFASNLVAGDTNNAGDIFVHDRQTGTTELVSVDSAGNQANNSSIRPAITPDGRFVAFDSQTSNLVAGDTNNRGDVFVRDRLTGTTERVSVSSAGVQGNLSTGGPAITADGRFVAFNSAASNLVAGDTNGRRDIFVHDRQTGTTERVSVDSSGNQGSGDIGGSLVAITPDGRFVAFNSPASNLVAGDTNNTRDVFVHDRQTGATTRVSVDSAGIQGNSFSRSPAISADGRFVAFSSTATNLVAGAAGGVFVHDRQTGATTSVSVNSAGNQGNGESVHPPDISADGRFVAFLSQASNLVAGDNNGAFDVFVHDRLSGNTERVSVSSAGNEANADNGRLDIGQVSITADGRFVAFSSFASNLVASDTDTCEDIEFDPITGEFVVIIRNCSDVFVHDREGVAEPFVPGPPAEPGPPFEAPTGRPDEPGPPFEPPDQNP